MNKPNEQPGIYQILNLKNGKCYIGQGKNISNRCAMHRSMLRANKHPNKHLQAAWNKYSEQVFEFRKIVNLPLDKDLLTQAEQYWCDYFSTDLYNKRNCVNSNLGIKSSEHLKEKLRKSALAMNSQTRLKIIEARRAVIVARGYVHSAETRKKISNSNRGHTVSDETREKIGSKKRGQKHSSESRLKMSKTRLANPRKLSDKELERITRSMIGNSYRKGKVSPNKGKKMSEEQKKKISISKTGHPSPFKGKKHSEETKKKISATKTSPDIISS